MPKIVFSSLFSVDRNSHSDNRPASQAKRGEQPTTNSRKSKGFTLIELLVAIAIVGILASIGLAVYSNAQLKGRDARRKADLDSLQKALVLYKSDTPLSEYYPKQAATTQCDNTASTSCIPKTALIDTGYTYIKKIPEDPKTKKDYYYETSGGLCNQTTPFAPSTANCTTFKLVACLENPSDPQQDPSTNTIACPGWAGSSLTIENY